MHGDSVSLISDTDIVNQGQIAASSIALRAGNDVRNVGCSIGIADTASTESLAAGRDIVLQTTTLASRSANGSSTLTSIDRVATLQGGTITLDAARDIVAQGVSLAAARDLSASAGCDLQARFGRQRPAT